MPPHLFAEFVLPRLAKIAEEVKKECPKVPMTVFGRGLSHALEQLAATKYVAHRSPLSPLSSHSSAKEASFLQRDRAPAV